MYENQTQEEILSRMLEEIVEVVDKRQGSIVFDMLSPASIELALAYIELDNVLNFGFAGTTYGQYLEQRANEVGLERKPSVQATGTVTLQGPADTFIPAGTQVTTEDDIIFETTQEGTIQDDEVPITLNARAVEGGLAGNISPNEITEMFLGELASLIVVGNSAFEGGLDAESDEALLERYYQRVRRPATSGNKNHYIQWATEVTGVGGAKAQSLWNGEGTVRVIIVNTDMEPASSQLISQTQTHINAQAPVGATPTVITASTKSISLTVDIDLSSDKTLADAQAEITTKVREHLKSIAFRETVLRYSKIGSIILQCESVEDYSNLLVNDSTENVTFLETEVPVIGSVTINEQS